MTTQTVDYEAVKTRQQSAWETGDYARIGNTLQTIAERLVEASEIRAGQRVLDVACGQGNAALAAARRFAVATGVDYVSDLLRQGRERAAAEHLPVDFSYADAEALPFADGTFDATLSTIGVMFAPNQQQAADEMVRVTRRGCRIAHSSWTPEGLVGAMFRTIGNYAPPPAGVSSPMLWGTEQRLVELFDDRVEWVSITKRTFDFTYNSPVHFAEWFCRYYGPIAKLAGSLDEDTRRQFGTDLALVATRFNRSGDATVLAAGEYLEAVGVRR